MSPLGTARLRVRRLQDAASCLRAIDASVHLGSHVACVNCEMGRHIAPEGWTITGGAAGPALRFWEYQSTAEGGGPLDVSRRHPSSEQISADQAAILKRC